MAVRVVQSLEELAFKASFKDILATLVLCTAHRPKGRRCESLVPSVFSNSFLTSEKLRKFLRNHLDQHLNGLVGVEVRQKFVKRLYDHYLESPYSNKHVHVWVFFDVVLDDSFKELETHISFPDAMLCTKLIPTITKWSPLVQKLTINFQLIVEEYDDIMDLEELNSFVTSLGSLKHLTHLSLYPMSPSVRLEVLSRLGKACPSLTHLTVNGACMHGCDIYALIFGEFPVYKFWLVACKLLKHLSIPLEFIAPICSSLRELRLIGQEREPTDDHPDVENPLNQMDDFEFAFALRHLPLLQVADKRFPTSLAVTILHEVNIPEEEKSWSTFQKAHEEAFGQSGISGSLPQNATRPFTGKLLLTRLDFVNVKDEKMLRAVGALCPMLKEVVFCDRSFETEEDYDKENQIVLENDVDPENLQAIFNGWPKLTMIGLHKVPLKYVQPILKVFGAELQHLKLKSAGSVKLADLVLCQKLESLRILGSTTLLPESFDSTPDAATFLPQLKSFESDVCLGFHSLLFEEKSTLLRLVLHCSHVNIDTNEPLQKRFKHSTETSNHSGLLMISKLWSGLEVLAIWQFSQLSMLVMSDLIPHLRNLKLVTLPERIERNYPSLSQSTRQHLLGRNPPVNLSFKEIDTLARCQITELH